MRWHINVDPTCVLCKREVETLKHLFFQCDYSREVWKLTLDNLGFIPFGYNLEDAMKTNDKCCTKKTPKAKLYTMCLTEAGYGIWIERNNKVFNDTCKPVAMLYREIVFRVACRATEDQRLMLVH